MGSLPAPARPDRETATEGVGINGVGIKGVGRGRIDTRARGTDGIGCWGTSRRGAAPMAQALLDRRRLFGVAAVAAASLLGAPAPC